MQANKQAEEFVRKHNSQLRKNNKKKVKTGCRQLEKCSKLMRENFLPCTV